MPDFYGQDPFIISWKIGENVNKNDYISQR